jgi:endonuclease/exonuclease/phosphatase family metal-dependent hydrolase
MTYNIQFGLNWPATRDLIRRECASGVDVLCLQEVPEPDHRDPRAIHPCQILEDFDWPHDLRTLWHQPHYRSGNMTLVRGRLGPGRFLETPLSNPYGCAYDVTVGDARLTVANVHMTAMLGPPPIAFPVSEMYRLREALDLTRRYRRLGGPVVALGDFNTFWPAPACWVMRRHWRDCRLWIGGQRRATRPTYGLPFVIDYVFTQGGIVALDYKVVVGGGSDHRAVVATLQVPVTQPRGS